jgi:hypothetical protein
MQPQSPNPDFDFMLKNNPQPKPGLGLPSVNKPVKIAAAVVIVIIILIIGSSILSSGKGNGVQTVTAAIVRGQEIIRVTQLVQNEQLQDPGTTALAATISSTLSSQQAQLTAYLAQGHTKLSSLQLSADTDKTVDAQMQAASQNSQLDETYKNYLTQSLAKYQSDLDIAYKSVGPNGKALLKDAFDSNNVLMSNPPLKISSQSFNAVCNAQGASAC